MAMNSRALADELGITRRRIIPSTSHPVPPSTVPHLQTWTLSQDANKKCGTCRVCFATRQLHMKDGTVHNHGPRGKLCSGSISHLYLKPFNYNHRLIPRLRQRPLLQIKAHLQHVSCHVFLCRSLRSFVIPVAKTSAFSSGFRKVPIRLQQICCRS